MRPASAPPGERTDTDVHAELAGAPDRRVVCHLTLDGAATLCGGRGLAMLVSACQDPRRSPCEGGCHRMRCPECVRELDG